MTIDEKRNDKGQLIGWKVRVCVGREGNKQKWKTMTVRTDDPIFDGIVGNGKRAEAARAEKLNAKAREFEDAQKEEFTRQQETKGKNPDAVIFDKRKITLPQYVRNIWWRDVLASKPRPNTLAFYQYTSDNICKYFEGLPKAEQRLYKMEARTAKDFINYLKLDAVGSNGKPMSETTILRHWQTFRNIINSALRDEYIMRDPCLKFKPTDKPTTPRYDGGFLNREQARTFIRYLDDEELQWRCLINILVQHGLRRGEVVGLRWADVRTEIINGNEYHVLDIQQGVTPDVNAENKMHIGEPKTKESKRTILIQPEIYDMLMELKEQREKDYQIKIMPTSENYIFCRVDNPAEPLYPTLPTAWLNRFIKRHNRDHKEDQLPDVSPHDLRRTWATLANEAGVNQKAMQSNLGHSDGSDNDVERRHYIKMTLAGQIDTLNTMHRVFYGEENGSEREAKQA